MYPYSTSIVGTVVFFLINITCLRRKRDWCVRRRARGDGEAGHVHVGPGELVGGEGRTDRGRALSHAAHCRARVAPQPRWQRQWRALGSLIGLRDRVSNSRRGRFSCRRRLLLALARAWRVRAHHWEGHRRRARPILCTRTKHVVIDSV